MCIILRAAQSRLNYPAINISEWEWSRTSSETNMYSFEYDPLDRLADSTKVRAVDADGEVHKHFKRPCAY